MSPSKPKRGPVKGGGRRVPFHTPRRIVTPPARAVRDRELSGEWRPDTGYVRDRGLRMTMRAWPGLTDPGVLRVPFRFQVPVTGDFERSWEFDWARYTTLRLGERARPSGQKLMDLAIDTIFVDGPNQDDGTSYVVWDGAPDPQRLIDELRYIMGKHPSANGKATPFRLTVGQSSVWPGARLVNECMVLTGLRAVEKAEEVGTESISLAFLEYERTDVDRRRQPRASDSTQHHTLRSSDDLYEIAKRYYGAPSLWRTIAKKNGISGVSPGSESGLASWARKHKRTKLTIPPKPRG